MVSFDISPNLRLLAASRVFAHTSANYQIGSCLSFKMIAESERAQIGGQPNN